MQREIFTAFLLCLAGTAAAQSDSLPDPRDSQTKVPAVAYRSAFEGYRPYADPELAPWREVNDEVRRLGGHAGYVQKGAPAAKPHAHGGHK